MSGCNLSQSRTWTFVLIVLCFLQCSPCCSFLHQVAHRRQYANQIHRLHRPAKTLLRAQISEREAQTAIDKVVAALRKDSKANDELGRLDRVTVVVGYGSPVAGSVAVRFNAAFRKSGRGLSAVPMPFGLGQTNESEGRGTMVGQVKATVDVASGKVSSCSVFRDLGYGRSFNL